MNLNSRFKISGIFRKLVKLKRIVKDKLAEKFLFLKVHKVQIFKSSIKKILNKNF
jgi:hypothetical protein